MKTFVKICGICSREDLEQISALGPDAVGFVFWSRSSRHMEPEAVGRWNTPASIRRVGVFVDPTEEELYAAWLSARLDVLQVHRVSEDWQVNRARFPGAEFWNAVSPDECALDQHRFDFDRLLLDSYDPNTVGGTGKVCDWSRAAELVEESVRPVLLAGGLTAENVGDAIRTVGPWGVDVSSKVQVEPRQKDLVKVAAFIDAVRSA
jgi:phosphoribosylanthranilate isomerase